MQVQVLRTGTMGMTHLLARMKSLLREQNAWQGYADEEEQAPGSMQPPQSLDVLTEEPEDESQLTEDDADHVSNDENAQPLPDAAAEPQTEFQDPEQLQDEGRSSSSSINNHEEEPIAASTEPSMLQHHHVPCQAETDQPSMHDAAPEAASEADQDPTRQLTDNPTYTTNPSTPNMGYPLPIVPSPRTSHLAPHDMQQPVGAPDQASSLAASEALASDTKPGVSPFEQHGHQTRQASEGTRYEDGVDVGSMSREELITTIQELEQQVVAGQMALAETEERLAFSQQRLQVCS